MLCLGGFCLIMLVSYHAQHVYMQALIFSQPHNTRWMTPAERRLAQIRLAEDAGEADEDTRTDT